MTSRVWIVEIYYVDQPRWHPTVGCALSRDDARVVLAEWKRRNPSDRFRIRRYVARGEG